MDHDQFGLVEDARNPRVIAKTAADHAAVFKDTRGIFGEQSLPGCINASAEYAPLSAVRVPANGQIDVCFLNVRVKIFGMMAEKKLDAVLLGKALQRIRVGRVFLPVDARGQAADAQLTVTDAFVLQKRNTRLANTLAYRLIGKDGSWMPPRVPLVIASDLMIAQGIIGRSELGAFTKEAVAARIGIPKLPVVHQIPGDQDQVGGFFFDPIDDLAVIAIVQIRGNGDRLANVFARRGDVILCGLHIPYLSVLVM